jgi:hypothetical protein
MKWMSQAGGDRNAILLGGISKAGRRSWPTCSPLAA